MNNKEKIRSIVWNIIQQREKTDFYLSTILLSIDTDSIISEPIEFKKRYLLDICDKDPNIHISFNDMMLVIDYLESMQVLQKLIK